MASNSTRGNSARRTRLQVSTEKRRSDEMIREKEKSKLQMEMFAQNKLIGPRDILVNSHLPKVKLEEGVGCSSSVKLEPLEAEPSLVDEPQDSFVNPSPPKIKLEVESGLVVKVEETLELNDSISAEQLRKHDSSLQTSKTSESQLSSLLPSSIPQTKADDADASFDVQESSSSKQTPVSADQIPKPVGQLKHHQTRSKPLNSAYCFHYQKSRNLLLKQLQRNRGFFVRKCMPGVHFQNRKAQQK